jgi:uncharacterized protein (DUF952 family)
VVLIYKILLPAEWAEFDAGDAFEGSPFDIASGFVHCSAQEQVAAVARRLFAGEPSLVVVALDTDRLADRVRWEPAPEGGLFPHVYGLVPRDVVVEVHHLAGAAGVEGAFGGVAPQT